MVGERLIEWQLPEELHPTTVKRIKKIFDLLPDDFKERVKILGTINLLFDCAEESGEIRSKIKKLFEHESSITFKKYVRYQ
jgi:hypothetical protein